MNYPIFNAIVNQVETRLSKRAIEVDHFRIWTEEKINAAGLEISMDLSDRSNHLKKLVINLDWDKFREASLARQMPGMEKHPFLKIPALSGNNITPYIDVETMWYFDEEVLYQKLDSTIGNRRMEAASQWMEFINKELKRILTEENIITRWHVEIEGDLHGRYVTDMSLISYMQYKLDKFTSINEINAYVEQNIQKILLRTQAIMKIASKTLEMAA
ncbi:hypothetical protein QLX67_06090 [Balneolaceae bacterium ANBcel3]|nr:hypothetical protein [Balneolaceae bacterium ANBcel3]